MIVFKKLRWKNFLSYGENWTELELDKHSTTLIIGENGAGKSTFMDVLSYALFMKPLRKINNPMLVNSINKRHLVAEVEFSIGPTHYKVSRGHAPRFLEVFIDGDLVNQDAHTKDYQQVLENQILKMNHKTFTQIVMLGSTSFVPFMQLSAAHRRDIIEDLLDIEIFTVMASLMKNRAAATRDKLMQCEYEIDKIEHVIKIQEEYIVKLASQKNEEVEKKKREILSTKRKIESLKKKIGDFKADRDGEMEKLTKRDKLSAKSTKLLDLERQIERGAQQLRKRYDFFGKNDDCPTCGQDLDAHFKHMEMEKTQQQLREKSAGLEAIADEITKTNQRIDEFVAIQNRVVELDKQIQSLGGQKEGLEQYIKTLQSFIDETENNKQEAEDEASKLQNSRLELAGKQQEKTDLGEQKVIDELAAAMLKDTGIKSQIIKQYVPVMNKLINKYLAAMDFFVQFELDENFNEVIRSRYRDEFRYESFSEGEKMRIDLALLFTWRAIAKLKNSASTNLLIMDEVFDGSLDTAGTDEFLKIIAELSGDTNIIIISHKTDQLLDKFDNVIRFAKVKNFSQMVA